MLKQLMDYESVKESTESTINVLKVEFLIVDINASFPSMKLPPLFVMSSKVHNEMSSSLCSDDTSVPLNLTTCRRLKEATDCSNVEENDTSENCVSYMMTVELSEAENKSRSFDVVISDTVEPIRVNEDLTRLKKGSDINVL